MTDTKNVNRRWGILTLSVLMFLSVFSVSFIGGSKGSLISVFWIVVGYLAYKGQDGALFLFLKVIVIIEAGLILIIAGFLDSKSSIFDLHGSYGKASLLVGCGVMLVVKIGILLYLISQKKEVSGGAVGVVFPAGEAIRPEAALPRGLSEIGGTRASLLARSGAPSRSSISDTVTAQLSKFAWRNQEPARAARLMPLDWRAQGAVFARAVVTASRAQFGSYGWRDHCRGLFQIQVAA